MKTFFLLALSAFLPVATAQAIELLEADQVVAEAGTAVAEAGQCSISCSSGGCSSTSGSSSCGATARACAGSVCTSGPGYIECDGNRLDCPGGSTIGGGSIGISVGTGGPIVIEPIDPGSFSFPEGLCFASVTDFENGCLLFCSGENNSCIEGPDFISCDGEVQTCG